MAECDDGEEGHVWVVVHWMEEFVGHAAGTTEGRHSETERRQGRPRPVRWRLLAFVELAVKQPAVARVEVRGALSATGRRARRERDRPEDG